MVLLSKYMWVVSTLLRAGERGLSLKELNERWVQHDMSYGKPIPRQTFDRWKGAILDTIGVVVECHLQWPYRYYISNPRVLAEGALGQWLLDTFNTFNSLSQHVALQERILVEEIPSSRNFLTDILDAMREGKIIEIVHRKFSDAEARTHRVAPYCVKMSLKRWYMLALNTHNDELLLYGLDRIEAVQQTEETFQVPKTFNARDYFSTFFGVVHDESVQVERIVLRALSPHHNYLRSLPLHSSQREIATTEEYADFELILRPTYDFCFELLSRGGMIEVLAPQSLRHTMHTHSRELWERYKDA